MKPLLALTLLASPLVAQTTWYVDDDSCPSFGIGTEFDPFCMIQAAIQVAADGDLVLVSPGTYSGLGTPGPVVDFSGKNIAVRSTHGPSQTRILQGNPNVIFQNGEGRAAVLEGFAIQVSSHGVVIIGASPTLRGNHISSNFAADGGGGLRITGGASPLIIDNLVQANGSYPPGGRGGGFYIDHSSPSLVRNQILDNTVFADYGTSYGAGIYALDSNLSLVGNLVAGNKAWDELQNYGGGLSAANCTLVAVGNTFSNNFAADGDPFWPLAGLGWGGALHLTNTQAALHDTILWNDRATNGAEIATLGGNLTISFCDLAGGAAGIFGSASVTLGSGVLDTDPMLSNFKLAPNSPLVDAGSFNAAGSSFVDADFDPRVLDGNLDGLQRVDIGWDEVSPTQITFSGSPTPGHSLTFQITAPIGWNYGLAYSTGVEWNLSPPYGALLLDPSGLHGFGSGAVPGTEIVTLPNSQSLFGIDVHVQGFAMDPSANIGSYSRRISLRLQ